MFDGPTTRGLYDPTTGVYWASDAFAVPMSAPVREVAELDQDFWTDGMPMFAQYISPWLSLVDEAKFQRTVDRVEALSPSTIVGCHTPVIGRSHVARAIEVARRAPWATVAPQPDQAVLDEIQRALTLGVAA